MEKQIKVGDKFRVFEVIKPHYSQIPVGSQFCENKDEYFKSKYGINTPYLIPETQINFHFNIQGAYSTGQVKQIGQLVIKSVK